MGNYASSELKTCWIRCVRIDWKKKQKIASRRLSILNRRTRFQFQCQEVPTRMRPSIADMHVRHCHQSISMNSITVVYFYRNEFICQNVVDLNHFYFSCSNPLAQIDLVDYSAARHSAQGSITPIKRDHIYCLHSQLFLFVNHKKPSKREKNTKIWSKHNFSPSMRFAFDVRALGKKRKKTNKQIRWIRLIQNVSNKPIVAVDYATWNE